MRNAAILLGSFFVIFMTPMSGEAQDLPRYAVVLNAPAAAEARSQGGATAVGAARERIISDQAVVQGELASRGLRITGASRTLLNAIFVAATPEQANQLKNIPGVSDVVRLKRFRLKLDHAEQLINVPAAWNLLGGVSNAGAGIKIGLIDTGVEATHPAFQDPTLTAPAGFPICTVTFPSSSGSSTTNTLQCTDADATKGFPLCMAMSCVFTSNKIIVARSYVPLLNSDQAATSRPDDNSPRDRIGHGTAVAMAAAGVTVTGPSDTITGVAPKAFIGSYKVFGSPGLNDYTSGDLVIQALDDAFNDGMDIVSMSLGAPAFSAPLDRGATCGLSLGEYCDPEAYAVQNAVNSGMVVVVAAGNEGENGQLSSAALSTMGSPADAPGAIAVAATTNSHTWGYPLTINGLGSYVAQLGTGPTPPANFSGPLGDVATVGDPQACTAPPSGSMAGMIALVARGVCTFLVKVQNLQTAGAIGVVFTNNPGDDTLVVPSGLNGTTIPAAFVGYDDGQTIRNYLTKSSNTKVSLSNNFAPFDFANYNQVAPFSSHGPALGGSLKPDVAAVGVDLYLAGETYDPNGELYASSGFLVSQGTSFSTPQVAGVAAMVKQNNPNLTPAQIKAAIMNTATQDVTEGGNTASVLAVGAGKVNAGSAVANTFIVTPASVSFGILNSSSLPTTQTLQLANTGASTLNLSVSITRRTAETNAHISINLPNISVPAYQTASLNLTLSGSLPTPGIYEGLITITGAASPITIPYLYLVGDGVPKNLISIVGDGDDGTVGQQTTSGLIIFQIIDQYGVPVTNYPVNFAVATGGGELTPILNVTDGYGFGGASVFLGPNPGANVYTATAGTLTATFTATGVTQPAISTNGIVNAANYAPQAPAPGSYIAIFGNNLAPSTATYTTPYLPLSLNNVSVSFDNPLVSVPGHIVFVSPGQINVQVPWELQGQTSVQMKVSVGDIFGNVYLLKLASYSPAMFQITSGGQTLAAALDENYNIATVSNPVARGHMVQLFGNGLGPVNNQPASGDPAPSGPLATTTTTPVVTIGGSNAQVLFSGMTPGNAGLYQIDAVVPDTAPTGLQQVKVSIGGVTSPALSLPIQ